MSNLIEQLEQFGFKEKGQVVIHKDHKSPWFDLAKDADVREGHVYIWISKYKSQKPKILYIEKAGKGIKKRFREHFGGFNGGSVRGEVIAQDLKRTLKTGAR